MLSSALEGEENWIQIFFEHLPVSSIMFHETSVKDYPTKIDSSRM